MRQVAVRAVYVRGGTSRAIVFRQNDLPADRSVWDAIFLAAMGSPDPNGRQLNGLGGGISSLSKIAIVGPPSRPDADVDYTLGQVAVSDALVQYRANCGNISAAIGPFAIDEALVPPRGNPTIVRIHNTNTRKLIEAAVPVAEGAAEVDGDFVLPGVAGTGAPIRLTFRDPGGATTGQLLPTGRARDVLKVAGVGAIDVSLVDAVNPTVFVSHDRLGLTGRESPDELSRASTTLATFEEIRVAAAVAMGLASEDEARRTLRNLPAVSIVAPPAEFRSLRGEIVPREATDITTRVIASGQPHRAIPVSAALCLAIAARIPGSVPRTVADLTDLAGDLRIGQPSGITTVGARVSTTDGIVAEEATVYRTARRIMEGRVLVPAAALQSRLVSS